MRILALSLLCVACFGVESTAAPSAPAPTLQPVETTADDLQNLCACARLALPNLTPEQIVSVAVAIKHAEQDIAAMRNVKAETPPLPVEVKK